MDDDLTTRLNRKAAMASEAEARDWRAAADAVAERDRYKAQRDRAASVAHGFALFAEPDDLADMIADEDPAEAARIGALIFPEPEPTP